jgi:toxin ParE1/3/4
MTLLVAFRPPARAEFIDAAAWYEARRPALGAEFIAEIEHCIALAAQKPLRFAMVHNSVRRVIARRFPYSVYYRVETDSIVVMAVFHASRDPLIWQRRT